VLALIDADIVVHRVGYTTDNDEEWVAKARCNDMLDGILVDTAATGFGLWLSDNRDNTFRFHLSSKYKANRVAPRPKHYDFIKGFLIQEWGASIAHEMEADDAMGIAQDKSGSETVICSIDKDLLQIPGQHYNFVKKEWECVTEWEGLTWFYKQILIGDASDNVRGCKGIGTIKAGKALDKIGEKDGEEALFKAVYQTYCKQEKDWKAEEILRHILLAGRLLKIKQKQEEELWHFPNVNLMQEHQSLSTQPKQAGSIPSTEHTTVEVANGLPQHGASRENTSKEGRPA
jgi:5'-3' exonuclease